MRLRTIPITLLIIFLLAFGCSTTTSVTPTPPVVTDQADCSAACSNLRKLGCEDGLPIDMHVKCTIKQECNDGQECVNGSCQASCEQFCLDTENQGVWLDPGCVAHINACNEIDSCPVPKKVVSPL